jgi:hypothetical protein
MLRLDLVQYYAFFKNYYIDNTSKLDMTFDFETKISAKLINEKTIVINPKMQ